ncbi:hypothetical protein ACSQ5K_26495 [Pseudomonas sp. PhalM4]
MSKFIKWSIFSFTTSAAVAFSVAENLNDFGNILGITLFAILLGTVVVIAAMEYLGSRGRARADVEGIEGAQS